MKKFSAVALVLALLMVFISCPTGGDSQYIDDITPSDTPTTPTTPSNPSNSSASISKEYWGTWIRMDNGDIYTITDKTVTVNGNSTNGIGSITRESENVLKYGSAPTSPRLFRKGGTNRNFTAQLAGFGDSNGRAASIGIQGITGRRQNKNNASDKQEVKSDNDGILSFTGAVADDEQKVEVDVGNKKITVDVTPQYNGENIGTIPIVESGYSFKTTYAIIDNGDWYYYGNNYKSYSLDISINNIGDADCPTALYEVSCDDPKLTISGDKVDGIVTTIEPGKKLDLSYKVSYGELVEEYKDVTIKIKITDSVTRRTWNDYVTLRFYRKPIAVSVSTYSPNKTTDSELHGFVVTPDGRSQYFSVKHNNIHHIEVPWCSSENPITLVFSGATADYEMYYEFKAEDAWTGSYWSYYLSDFIDWESYLGKLSSKEQFAIVTSYEGNSRNDTENSAALIENGAFSSISYIQKGDIDYFSVDTGKVLIANAKIPKVNVSENSIEVTVGKTTNLEVSASVTDKGTLSYQWYKADSENDDGVLIAGATSSFYTTESINNNVYYYCLVTNTIQDNGDGGIKSSSTKSSYIKVIADSRIHAEIPTITKQPSLTVDRVLVGDKVTLSVDAVLQDDGTLNYQWYKASSKNDDGVVISGATTQNFELEVSEVAYYYCKVSNMIQDNGDGGSKVVSRNSNKVYVKALCEIVYQTEYGTPPETKYVKCGSKLTDYDLPKLEDQTSSAIPMYFKGWYSEEVKVQEGFEIKTNLVFVALWDTPEVFVKVNGVTITGRENWTPSSSVFVSGRRLTIPDLIVCDHEVTRREFKKVMGIDPSTASAYNASGTLLFGDDVLNNPVNYVNWYAAITYCNKLSLAEKLTPCYSVGGITDWATLDYSSVPTSNNSIWNAVNCNFEANGYRLPTEAEWEWLARGGENYIYSGSNTLDEVGWVTSTTNDTGTREVKTKKENGYGLYDMTGNVWEWCWDWYGSISSTLSVTGTVSGSSRIMHGGSWFSLANLSAVAFRNDFDYLPGYRHSTLGFRVVRTVK